MENNVYKQYNQIESYIISSSEITDLTMNRYFNFLNDTSILFEITDSITFMKVLGYYDIIHDSIQNKFQEIDSFNLRTLNTENNQAKGESYFKRFFKEADETLEEVHNYYENKFEENQKKFESTYSEYYKKTYKEIFDEADSYCHSITENIDGTISNITDKINSLISKTKEKIKNLAVVKKIVEVKNKFVNKIKNMFNSLFPNNSTTIWNFDFIDKVKNLYKKVCKFEFKKEFKLNKEFPIDALQMFPYIQLRIIPYAHLGVYVSNKCIKENSESSSKNPLEKYDFGLFFDAYANAKVSIALHVGYYYPGISSTLEISIIVGIDGILGSGKIGVKLDFYLSKGELQTDLYYEFNTFELSFYVLFKFKIELKIKTFRFSFYIFNKTLKGLSKSNHKEKVYKFY